MGSFGYSRTLGDEFPNVIDAINGPSITFTGFDEFVPATPILDVLDGDSLAEVLDEGDDFGRVCGDVESCFEPVSFVLFDVDGFAAFLAFVRGVAFDNVECLPASVCGAGSEVDAFGFAVDDVDAVFVGGFDSGVVRGPVWVEGCPACIPAELDAEEQQFLRR